MLRFRLNQNFVEKGLYYYNITNSHVCLCRKALCLVVIITPKAIVITLNQTNRNRV